MKIDIKGYDIIREISRGPISTAYLGKQLSLNRPVLIKRLNNQWMNETDLMERFRREALICARLKHRNVVDIIDVETHPDNLYLVIEFIDGMDLARFIKEFSPLPFSVILYISREVLNGLAYAHRQGVIHRDIKPSNIMIGRDGIVKIADFGLARTADLPTISAHGEVVGTPAYMSPEQARISNLDERTDIFSLGITFYELAGQPSPFKGQSIVESIQKLLKDVPPPLHELNPEIPEWYSLLISKMLAKKTDDRPASAEAILENEHFLKTPSRSPELAQMIGQMNKESITFENTEISPPVIQSIDLPKSPGKRWLGIATTAVAVLLLGAWWINANQPDQKNGVLPIQDKMTAAAETLNTGADSLMNEPEIQSQPVEQNPEQPTSALAEKGSQLENRIAINQSANGENPRKNTTSPVTNTEKIELPVLTDSSSTPVAAPATGELMVQCTPWAHIFVNGEQFETTPLRKPLILPAGRHVIELRNPNFPPHRSTVEISGGNSDSLIVNLHSLTGYLDLQVLPWAKIFIDNQYVETTPLAKPLALKPGEYTLKLENPAFPNWEETVLITAGETLKHRITLNR